MKMIVVHRLLCVAVLAVTLTPFASAQQASLPESDKEAEAEQPQNPAVKQTLEELSKLKNDLSKQLERIEGEYAALESLDKRLDINDFNLPANPERKDYAEFIERLRVFGGTGGMRSGNSPLSMKLKQVPVQHVDLLVREIVEQTPLASWITFALQSYQIEELRQSFVNSLKAKPNEIAIQGIMMQGWWEDVRPEIIAYVSNPESKISPAWFQAAVELRDPTLYPRLHRIAAEAAKNRFERDNAAAYIRLLTVLPDYNIGYTVEVCLKNYQIDNLQSEIRRSDFAVLAARLGNREALGMVIFTLPKNAIYSFADDLNQRLLVLRLIDFHGTNEEIKDWYKKNKDNLVYDSFTQRFCVLEPE